VRAKLARHAEALGEETVEHVGNRRRGEQPERNPHLVRGNRPDNHGYQQKTHDRNSVRKIHAKTRPCFVPKRPRPICPSMENMTFSGSCRWRAEGSTG
jgi:hypothetical protein